MAGSHPRSSESLPQSGEPRSPGERGRTEAPAFRKDHVPELDGLRGIAVLLVLWVHLPVGAFGGAFEEVRRAWTPGNVGVDLFFVLSGFLITRILLVDRERGVPLRHFLARRFLRIFPIYYLSIALLWPRLDGAEALACATYTANYAFLFKSTTSALEHTWSLAVEEHFYLAWPPLVVFLTPRQSRRVLLFGVLPLAIASCLGALFVQALVTDRALFADFVGRTSTVRFFSLSLGALLAYRESFWRDRWQRAIGVACLAAAAAWALGRSGASALGHGALLELIPGDGGRPDRHRLALLALSVPFGSVAAVVAGVALSQGRSPLGYLLRSRALRGLGRISYGVYLYHFPLFLLDVWGNGGAGTVTAARVAAVLGLTLAAAALSFAFIERPLLALGARFRSAPQGAPAAPPSRRATRWLAAGAVILLLGWLLRGGAVPLVDLLCGAPPVR